MIDRRVYKNYQRRHPQKLFLRIKKSWMVVGGIASLGLLSFATPVSAQTRCDASAAIGHIKRLEGPRGGVTIVRVGGATEVNPGPITPICPMDNIRTIGAAVAHVDVYGAAPVVVTANAPWKPMRARAKANLRQNILAMVMDKFLPDLNRTETAQRVRGGALDPTIAQIPSMRTGTDIVPIEELGGVIRIPVYGELWLSKAQLRGPGGSMRTSRAIEGQDIVFDATGLPLGLYELIATKVPASRLPPPTRVVGTFTVIGGRGPNLETTGGHPYGLEMAMGLRALWLADTHGARHGLLAYQLAARARMETIPPAQIADLVLKTLSPPAPLPANAPLAPPAKP